MTTPLDANSVVPNEDKEEEVVSFTPGVFPVKSRLTMAKEVEEENQNASSSMTKDILWDLVLWTGATALASGLSGGAGALFGAARAAKWVKPLLTASIYGGAKVAQESVTGETQPTATEIIAGQEFSPAVRAMTHAAEAGVLMSPTVTRVVGGATGKLLKGIDVITAKPLSKLSKAADPYVSLLYENKLVQGIANIPVPGTASTIEGGRTLRELFGPAVTRLSSSEEEVKKYAGSTFREALALKRISSSVHRSISKELDSMSLLGRREFTKLEGRPTPLANAEKYARDAYNKALRSTDPDVARFAETYRARADALKEASDAATRISREIAYETKIPLKFDAPFRESLYKKIGAKFEGDNPAVRQLFDPEYAHFTRTGFTKQTKKAMKAVIEDPGVSNDFKQLLKDLYALPARSARDVWEASKEAEMLFIKQRFLAEKGLLSATKKAGYVEGTHSIFTMPKEMQLATGRSKFFVPRDVELQILDMAKLEQYASKEGAKWMSLWKSGKTIMRPAYHIRNLFSNMILADWGGLPWYRGDVYLKAIREMQSSSTRWKEFIRLTGGAGTFTHDDLGLIYGAVAGSQTGMDVVWRLFRKGMGGYKYSPANIQNAEENLFKFAKFIHSTEERGLSAAEAILDAQKYLMNYGEASVAAGWLRSGMGVMSAMPFATWYTKIIPLTVDTAVKHPLRFSKWLMFGAAMQNHALGETGISENEWEEIKRDMPDWLRKGVRILMPWRDNQRRLNLFNATFLMPGIGDLVELKNLVSVTSPGGLQVPNPVISVITALASQEKSSGAPLYNDWEDFTVRTAKAFTYSVEQLMPSAMPGFGTDWNLYQKIIDEEKGAPTIEQAVLSSLGFKMVPLDPKTMKSKSIALARIHEQEIGAQLRKELRGVKTHEERQKVIEKYKRYKKKVISH